MSVELRVALPPEGMTARRLLMNFLAHLSSLPGCQDLEITLKPGHVIIEAASEDLIEECINQALWESGQVLQKSLTEHKLTDIPVHTNDRRWIFGKLGVQAPRGSKFCQLASQVLRGAQLPWDVLVRDLPVVRETANMIQLGDGVKSDLLSLPQPFLYERYQAKYQFLRGRSGDEMKFRATKAWLYVLFAGFALGYCGNYITGAGRGSELVIATVPELTLSQVLADAGARSLIIREGLFPVIRRLRCPPRPAIPYMLYASCELLKALGPQARELETIYEISTALLAMDRVSFTGQAFALIERVNMDFGPILRALARLDTKLIDWIQEKCRKAIVGRGGATEHYSDYVRLSIAIFQALSGALDPTDLCYYALRVVAEHETEGLDPVARLKVLRRESSWVHKLLKSLRGGF